MRKVSAIKVLSMACFMSLVAASASFAATGTAGWKQTSAANWVYEDRDGNEVTNEWKKSGDNWFYLGDEGVMETDAFIDDDGDYFFVDENGAMVRNQWRKLVTDSTDGEEGWYFFGSNGKALAQKSSSKATIKEVNGKKYIFNEEGVMQYGWIDAEGKQVDEDNEEAWKEAVYYAGTEDDGALSVGWKSLTVEDDEAEDFEGYYWFYFNPSNSKKIVDQDNKQINGKRYGFDENGAMKYEFALVASASEASPADAVKYFSDYDNGANLRNAWFKAVPSEEIDAEAYDNGDEYWFYSSANGKLKHSTLTTINGKKYAFNEKGEMLDGLRGLKLEGNTIVDYTDKIEEEAVLYAIEDEDFDIYYFGDEDEGQMSKSATTVALDDNTFKYEFMSSGKGRDGIYKDTIYVKGRKIVADKDYGYEMFETDGTKSESVGTALLVNTSGKIQKNKTNAKDKDDVYYCTDKSGVVTYMDEEKFVKSK